MYLAWHRARIRWEWKPQDCWIGVFWRTSQGWRDVWICLLPMLPIHISIPFEEGDDGPV